MPMSFGGHVASSSACATRPEVGEIGLSGFAAPTRHSSPIGRYVMATAGHREPCESRGSCTVLGAPEGESPSGDSSIGRLPAVHGSSPPAETPAVRADMLKSAGSGPGRDILNE